MCPHRGRHMIELENLAQSFNETCRMLCPLKRTILANHIERMNLVLQPGLTSVNWSSQCISAYVQKAKTAIDVFKSILCEIKKHSLSLDFIIDSIRKSSLVEKKTCIEGTAPTLENTILEKGAEIESKRKTMSSVVRKVQMVVKQSGGALLLAPDYYRYWEKRLYNALVEMTTRTLITLFYVRDIQSFQDASLFSKRGLKAIMHSLNQHNRWKANSCEEAILSKGDGNEEIFTFKRDIERNPSLRVLLELGKRHTFLQK